MSKYFKIVLGVLIITIASSVLVRYLFNKPFIDMANSKADFVFSGQVILNINNFKYTIMESLKSKISRSYHRWFGMVLLIPGLIFNNCS